MLGRIRTLSFDSATYDGRGFDARYSTDTGLQLRLRSEWGGIDPDAAARIDTDRYAKIWGLGNFGFLFNKILPVRLEVKALSLEPEEEERWRDWYLGHLGENFHRSRLPAEIDLTFSGEALEPRQAARGLAENAILLSGGGKDSAVAGELLKSLGVPFRWYTLQTKRELAERAVAEACGSMPLTLSRFSSEIRGRSGIRRLRTDRLRPFYSRNSKLLRTLGWSHLLGTVVEACLLGEASDARYILTGNERSASEGNGIHVGDLEVNHQYGKSFAFEREFAAFLAKYLHPDLRHGGLLMPFYDLQIAKMFARHPQYFAAFRSCNGRRSHLPWCLECPKCAFTYAILAAFIDEADLRNIFQANLLAEPGLVTTFRELCGSVGHKPLECVGEADESRLALYLASKRGIALHPDLAEELPTDAEADRLRKRFLEGYGEENALPAAWNDRLRTACP